MRTTPLASLSTRIPPPLLQHLADLRHWRSRRLGVRMQDLVREALEKFLAEEANRHHAA